MPFLQRTPVQFLAFISGGLQLFVTTVLGDPTPLVSEGTYVHICAFLYRHIHIITDISLQNYLFMCVSTNTCMLRCLYQETALQSCCLLSFYWGLLALLSIFQDSWPAIFRCLFCLYCLSSHGSVGFPDACQPHLVFKGGFRHSTQAVRPMPSSQGPVFVC